MRLRFSAAIAILLAATACQRGDDGARQRYLEARAAYGSVFARTLDESCPEEPACTRIIEVLGSIPDAHPDAVEAKKVLARIERAREENEVPAFLQPRIPAPDEVPAFLEERIGSTGGASPSAPPDLSGIPATAPAAEAPAEWPTISATAPAAEALTPNAETSTVLAIDGGDAPAEELAHDDANLNKIGEAPAIVLDGEVSGASATVAPAPPAPDPAADPCAPLREQLAKRRDWLARTAAERNTLAHIANPKDHAALLLLRTMQRCADHPDDPDCAPPPLTATVERFEVELDEVEREPGELIFNPDDPDAIAHDNLVHVLQGRLRKCEASRGG